MLLLELILYLLFFCTHSCSNSLMWSSHPQWHRMSSCWIQFDFDATSDFWIKNWFHITTHLVVLVLGGDTLQKAPRFKSDWDKIWQDCFSRKNMQGLPWRLSSSTARCSIAYAAVSASSVRRVPAYSSWSIVYSYLFEMNMRCHSDQYCPINCNKSAVKTRWYIYSHSWVCTNLLRIHRPASIMPRLIHCTCYAATAYRIFTAQLGNIHVCTMI